VVCRRCTMRHMLCTLLQWQNICITTTPRHFHTLRRAAISSCRLLSLAVTLPV